jgi:hypothetical protein
MFGDPLLWLNICLFLSAINLHTWPTSMTEIRSFPLHVFRL